MGEGLEGGSWWEKMSSEPGLGCYGDRKRVRKMLPTLEDFLLPPCKKIFFLAISECNATVPIFHFIHSLIHSFNIFSQILPGKCWDQDLSQSPDLPWRSSQSGRVR